jgi:hypothetical protein
MNKNFTEIDLITLLCSKLCHDLINPISAALNGCEMIDENIIDETNSLAGSLVRESLKRASSQIGLYRVAFGVVRGVKTSFMEEELLKILNSYNDNKKIKLDLEIDKNDLNIESTRLILNLYLVSLQLLPRGGSILISNKNSIIQSTCSGDYLATFNDISDIFKSKDIEINDIDIKLIQILFTKLIAEQAAKSIFIKQLDGGEGIAVKIKSL